MNRKLLAAAAALVCVSAAQARITEIQVQKVEPFAEGAAFGEVEV